MTSSHLLCFGVELQDLFRGRPIVRQLFEVLGPFRQTGVLNVGLFLKPWKRHVEGLSLKHSDRTHLGMIDWRYSPQTKPL